jgi:hypothetical protein
MSASDACTLVTAFYPIRSKFVKEQYVEWSRTFLRLASPIVLFTEEHLVPTFQALRGDRPIHFIPLPFEQLKTWTPPLRAVWQAQQEKNPERHSAAHTPELFALWAHKSSFVVHAIDVNPFQTDFFFWCDIGAFRRPDLPHEILERFPQTLHLPRDRILLQSMKPLPPSEKEAGADGIRGPVMSEQWNDIRIVGGLWGGGKEACLVWNKAFDVMLERYLKSTRFTGNDQMVMLSTYLEDPTRAVVVRPTRGDIDQWFFLEYLLSSLAGYEQEESYGG